MHEEAVRVRVPAKVNLHLHVLPPRADGFHDLETVFHAVSLFDVVEAARADALSVEVSGRHDGVPTDGTNLAARAARLLLGPQAAVRLSLHKDIPVAGGMAGGSADAAAALLACAQLAGVSADLADLAGLAAQLGSDVAFPLVGGTAVGTGRGEVLTPVECAPLHWVFVTAAFGISAGAAYAELDRLRAAGAAPEPAGPPRRLLEVLPTGDVDRIGALLANDLQAAALSLAPSLQRTLDAGLEAGAVAGLVSGSGPTCAFLCRSAGHATELASRLGGLAAGGPVPGATVV